MRIVKCFASCVFGVTKPGVRASRLQRSILPSPHQCSLSLSLSLSPLQQFFSLVKLLFSVFLFFPPCEPGGNGRNVSKVSFHMMLKIFSYFATSWRIYNEVIKKLRNHRVKCRFSIYSLYFLCTRFFITSSIKRHDINVFLSSIGDCRYF